MFCAISDQISDSLKYKKNNGSYTRTLILSSPVTDLERTRGFQEVKVPRFYDKAQEGGKFVSLRHRPHLHPGNTSGTHIC